jgi:hypothetical protein
MSKTQKLNLSKGDIAYEDDIVNEVVKRTGYTIEQVKSVYKFMFPALKKFMQRPEMTVVRCDNLGLFYFKSKYATHTAKALEGRIPRLKYKKKTLNIIDRVRSKSAIIDEVFKEECDKVGRKLQTMHYAKSLLHKKYFHQGKTLEFLEERQNKQL